MGKSPLLVMAVITYVTKIYWSIVLFSVMTEMMQKKSTGFVVQIIKMLKDGGFPFTSD